MARQATFHSGRRRIGCRPAHPPASKKFAAPTVDIDESHSLTCRRRTDRRLSGRRRQQMEYALLIYSEPPQSQPSPEQQKQITDSYNVYTKALVDAGAMRGGEALQDG